jgi:proteasome assembly chaperone (PAC2) family protein
MANTDEDILTWHHDPDLRRPIMVLGLEGLFDAAEAATSALRRLATRHGATPLAEIDPELFFDFTQRRPTVHFDGKRRRVLAWPANTIVAAQRPDADHDLLVLAGVEPHLRWRTFTDQVADIVQRAEAEMVVTLGAMAGLAPHTRPLGVVASSTDRALADRLGLGTPSYQGPTGVVGVLHDRLASDGVPVVSLRVSVPHYVPGPPNPEAARSLLSRLELVTGIDGGHDEMHEMASDWRARVDAAVNDDDDMSEYVRHLEKQVEDEADELLPSGDDLAAQLEAFLRNRSDGDD